MSYGNNARVRPLLWIVAVTVLVGGAFAVAQAPEKPAGGHEQAAAPAANVDPASETPFNSESAPPNVNSSAPAVGEVTGDSVYVRSGASENHYTITKLTRGEKVQIVGRTGEWLEIAPPAGVFSLVSGDFVDTQDDKTGVINGDNVRVRAGSLLTDNKYTVQAQLAKGAKVDILGRNPDGFLRIAPPPGATVWINRAYVRVLSGAAAIPDDEAKRFAAGDKPVTANTGDDATLPPIEDKPGDPGSAARAGKTVDAAAEPSRSALSAQFQYNELRTIDAAVRAELDKPVRQRNLRPYLDQFRAVEENPADEVNRKYAKARVEQLMGMMSVINTVGTMEGLNETAESKRREYLESRASLSRPVTEVPDTLDAKGELRVSALYPLGREPRRLRLVDTSSAAERTIGYVEAPADSPVDVEKYIGGYVGVRAATKRWQEGGVNPVPIFVLGELVFLERPAGSTDGATAQPAPSP